VPSMRFLGVLLSDEEVLTPEKRFYQRLLAADIEEAAEIAEEFLKGKSLEQLYDVVIAPAVALAEEDSVAGRLEDDQQEFVFDNARLLVEDIAPRAKEIIAGENGAKHRLNGKEHPRDSQPTNGARVLCLPAHGPADEIAALMLTQLLATKGLRAMTVSADSLTSERLEKAGEEKIEVVCVAALVPDGFLHARYLCKRLRGQFPDLRIVAAVVVREQTHDVRTREFLASANEVARSLSEAARQIQSLVPIAPAPAGQTAFSS
jgi:hypothetical protein